MSTCKALIYLMKKCLQAFTRLFLTGQRFWPTRSPVSILNVSADAIWLGNISFHSVLHNEATRLKLLKKDYEMRLPLSDLGHIQETCLHEPRHGPEGAITTDLNAR